MVDDYTLDDFTVGQEVKAFHPRTLGVIHYGSVEIVGRKWVHVKFYIDDRTYKMHPRYVVEIRPNTPSPSYMRNDCLVCGEPMIGSHYHETD